MMMLYSGLLEHPVRVPVYDSNNLVSNQSIEDIVDQTYHYNNEAMRNGNGHLSQVLVPMVPRVDEPEATKLSFPEEVVA